MANYANLKADIQAVVKQNGNQEITGNLLQQSLIAMINSLGNGYLYKGIATPSTNPGTPDQNIYYIAATAGIYANCGGISIGDSEVAILKYNGTWTKDTTNIASVSEVNRFAQEVSGINALPAYSGWPDSTGNIIVSPSGLGNYKVLAVKGGETVQFIGTAYIMILSAFAYNPPLPYSPTYATGETGRRTATNSTLTLPSDARYIVIAHTNNAGDDVFPSEIYVNGINMSIDIRKGVSDNEKNIDILNSVAGQDRFYGKKLSIIGDSISTFDKLGYKIDGYRMYYPYGNVTDLSQTWWYKIMSLYDMTMEVNASYSGSCVTNARASQGYPDFYDRTNLLGSPEVIFVALGLNDITTNVDIGNLAFNKSIAALSESNFCEAYIKGIKALKQNYPSAEIVCFSLNMSFNSNRLYYKQAIQAIANKYGCTYLDVLSYNEDTMTSGHPSASGMNTIANTILNESDIISIHNNTENIDTVGADIVPSTITFEQGGLYHGEPIDRNNRIRTANFIPASSFVKAVVERDYSMIFSYYDENKVWLSDSSSAFVLTSANIPEEAFYIKIVMAKSSSFSSSVWSSVELIPSESSALALYLRKTTVILEKYVNLLHGATNEKIASLSADIAELKSSTVTVDGLAVADKSHFYIGSDGTMTYSEVNWDSYAFENSDDIVSIKYKSYTNNATFCVVAFFSGVPSQATFLNSSILFGQTGSVTGTLLKSDIPNDCKYFIITNRKTSGTDNYIFIERNLLKIIDNLDERLAEIEPKDFKQVDSLKVLSLQNFGSCQGVFNIGEDIYYCTANPRIYRMSDNKYITLGLGQYGGSDIVIHQNDADYNAISDAYLTNSLNIPGNPDNPSNHIFILHDAKSKIETAFEGSNGTPIANPNWVSIDLSSLLPNSGYSLMLSCWGESVDVIYVVAFDRATGFNTMIDNKLYKLRLGYNGSVYDGTYTLLSEKTYTYKSEHQGSKYLNGKLVISSDNQINTTNLHCSVSLMDVDTADITEYISYISNSDKSYNFEAEGLTLINNHIYQAVRDANSVFKLRKYSINFL